MLQSVINAGVQLGFVLALSAILWAIFARKRSAFRPWIGLTAPSFKAIWIALLVSLIFIPASLAFTRYGPFYTMATSEHSIASQIADYGMTVEAAGVIVVTALIKTGLSEELLFRGLIAKRCYGTFGFWPGNVVQAGAFTALHLLFLAIPGMPPANLVLVAMLVLLIFPFSLLIGWLNEKMAGGSIAPGWIMHGLANLVAYPVLAFGLL